MTSFRHRATRFTRLIPAAALLVLASVAGAISIDSGGNTMDVRLSSGGAVSSAVSFDGTHQMFSLITVSSFNHGQDLTSGFTILPLSPDHFTVPVSFSRFSAE